MNSERNNRSNQDKTEVKVDVSSKNDQTVQDQATVTSKAAKLENGVTGEQVRLNSNSENNVKISSKTSVVLSNGTKSKQAAASDSANSLEQNDSQDASNTNTSSVFMSAPNIKPHGTNINAMCQLKHKTISGNSSASGLSKPQIYLNLSSTHANVHLNHNATSVPLNPTNATLHFTVSASASLISPSLSMVKPNDDIDMKNNVDYISAIEKCPSKVPCSPDSSPEADCSWTSKSYGSKRILNNIGGSIGSTSQGTCCVLRPNINGSKEVAGSSGLQRVCVLQMIEFAFLNRILYNTTHAHTFTHTHTRFTLKN